jgi:oligopeptide transport system substrate-binding protein
VQTKRWTLALAAVIAGVALAAAGCGGGDDDGGGGDGAQPAGAQTLRINIGAEPPSVDPVLATDNISSFVLQQIMDPLVKLDEDSQPVPMVAERWELEGRNLTFFLRHDAKWTNGDPVTAHDFEYAWKRLLDPKAAAEYGYQFWGIEGRRGVQHLREAVQPAPRQGRRHGD